MNNNRFEIEDDEEAVSTIRPAERVKNANRGRLMLMRNVATTLSSSEMRKAATRWCNFAEKELENNPVLPWEKLHAAIAQSPTDLAIIAERCPVFGEYIDKKQSGLIVEVPSTFNYEMASPANDDAKSDRDSAVFERSALIAKRARGIYARPAGMQVKASGE